MIDDHGSPVTDDVWALYRRLIRRTGPKPTLIEWDTAVPPWPVLHNEMLKADRYLSHCCPAKVATA